MRSCQTEVRELRMVELRTLPSIHRVTGFAGRRQIGGDVIERSRLLEVALMAADTRCVQPDKNAAGRTHMAVVAL